MSEYVEIEVEIDEDSPETIYFFTNQPLTRPGAPAEHYSSPAAMAEGSALAQALAVVEGLTGLTLEGEDLTAVRLSDTPEFAIIADISAVIRDFFL